LVPDVALVPSAEEAEHRVFLTATAALRSAGLSATYAVTRENPREVLRELGRRASQFVLPGSRPDLVVEAEWLYDCSVTVVGETSRRAAGVGGEEDR
jgi:hypothetical protein